MKPRSPLFGQVFDFKILGGHHFVYSLIDGLEFSSATERFHGVPSLEFHRLTTLSERFLAVSKLISSISVFANGSRGRMDTSDTILFSISVLATIASCTESLELEVLGG
jgi:hypothetical protein